MLLVFPGVEGLIGGYAVDLQQGSVQEDERLRRGDPYGLGQGGREVGQELDSLGDVAVGGGGADVEPGGELSVGLPVAQMGKRKQGLAAGGQTSPPGADHTAVLPQLLGEEAEGRAGHVDARRVDKHAKPLVEMVLLGRKPIYQGLRPTVSSTAQHVGQVGQRSRNGTLLIVSNSYAQPILRTADLSEGLRIVDRLLQIADLRDLEVDFDMRINSADSLSAVLAVLPDAEWWAEEGVDNSSERAEYSSAFLPVRLRSWAEAPETVEPFLEVVGGTPAVVRWDFNAWPDVPELGLGVGGSRGAFVTLCMHAQDLDLEKPASDHTVFVHVKQAEAERAPWLAAQVGMRVIGDLVMAPY